MNNTPKWTQGPWVSEAQGVFANDGLKRVATAMSHEHGIDWPTTEANVVLISVAPEMFDILMEYEEWEADVILNADWADGMPMLTQAQWDNLVRIQGLRNSAIRKARGEA